MRTLLDDYVRQGYAVVATGYAGLGTPGVHTHLLGGLPRHELTIERRLHQDSPVRVA